uniref:Uncharacterized LOC112153455 n=1 Tax=Oryzias melastigma TaxID=30732 RepID=A0A3B3DGH7_ORYME
MATVEFVAAVRALADDVDANRISSSDIVDRAQMLMERMAELSSVTVLNTSVAEAKFFEAICLLSPAHQAGRPTIKISVEALEGYIRLGLKRREIARLCGVSIRTISRRLQQHGLSVSTMYSDVTDAELDSLVLELHRAHPQCGYRMMRAYLQTRGHRVQIARVRESLRRVDPQGTEFRSLLNRTLHRRQYNVPAPNCLWHIDGNHKLIRWRLVIHGGIDGFSRLVVYLVPATNNRAATVLHAFHGAVRQFGVPSRVRSDKGRENVEVAHFMVQTQGENRNSHITGRSVHNQRIERLWKDVYTQVLDLFHSLFTEMEFTRMLNPDNEIHIYALHWVFLPLLQTHLKRFQQAWNFHSIRTENYQSPYQLDKNLSQIASFLNIDLSHLIQCKPLEMKWLCKELQCCPPRHCLALAKGLFEEQTKKRDLSFNNLEQYKQNKQRLVCTS